MGSGTTYKAGDEERWEVVRLIGGNKVLRQKKSALSNNLPTYSNAADYYFKQGNNGQITQMRVYGAKNSRGVRVPVMDIDLGYTNDHRNPGGKTIPDGVLHIHDFYKDANNKYKRREEARYPTLGEMGKYLSIWKKANPKVKIKLKY